MKSRPGQRAVNMKTPEQFAEQLASTLPTQLKCVLLFGSAAAGDFVAGASNYNLLAVIEPLGMVELDAISPAVVAWNQAGNPIPLFFTPQQLIQGTEAFPIELLDIEQSRRILWGSDLLENVRVETAQLRRQIERELTGKLLKLRGRYMLVRQKPHAVTELMVQSLSTFLVLFRAALRLYQKTVPNIKLEALHALSKHIEFDTKPFERIYELKSQPRKGNRVAEPVSFGSYLGSIEHVTNAIVKTGINREQ
jgi:hypothetical protein